MPEIQPLDASITAQLNVEALMEALGEALQTMAFVSLDLPMEPPAAPGPADLYTLPFTGRANGAFILAAPRALGALIACNMLALDPGEESERRAPDAVREICNVTSGLFLRPVCAGAQTVEMGLPTCTPIPDGEAWDAFIAQPDVMVVLADGLPLAAAVRHAATGN